MAVNLGNSTVLGSLDSVGPLKNSTSGSTNSNNLNSSNSDLSYHHHDEDGNGAVDEDTGFFDEDDYVSDYDDNDNFLYDDSYVNMQTQFDNVDLPPGVEATLPWLKDPKSSPDPPASTSTLIISDNYDILLGGRESR